MSQVHIETLGCRLNQIESEAIAGVFTSQNFTVSMESITASSQEDVSVLLCIINTCTVTQKAEQKARRIIRMLLKKFPSAAVLVTGCYAQLSAPEIERLDPRVCAVGGQIKSRIADVPGLLSAAVKETLSPEVLADSIRKNIALPPRANAVLPENSFRLAASSFLAHSRASLKIQDGCNSSCSYCAIHFARGKSVSIDVQTALERVLELEEKGNDEVVLTSVNICQYRSEYQGKSFNFAKLLAFLLENTKKINFRISSLYPQVVDDEFCAVISDGRVRPHFHISVQSGSDAVLSLMNRSYKAEAVRTACSRLRAVRQDAFLACDIITGFPGETDEDFSQTMRLVQECDFSWVHAFPFSERPGTVACTLKNKVPQSVSGERSRALGEWAAENKIRYLERFIGTERPAVLENARRQAVMSPGIFVYHAVTDNFIHCELRSGEILPLGKTVRVRIKNILTAQIKKGGEIEVFAEISG